MRSDCVIWALSNQWAHKLKCIEEPHISTHLAGIVLDCICLCVCLKNVLNWSQHTKLDVECCRTYRRRLWLIYCAMFVYFCRKRLLSDWAKSLSLRFWCRFVGCCCWLAYNGMAGTVHSTRSNISTENSQSNKLYAKKTEYVCVCASMVFSVQASGFTIGMLMWRCE